MGRGIAFACTLGNLNVSLQDISEASLETAKAYIDKQFQKSIEKGKVTEEKASKLRGYTLFSRLRRIRKRCGPCH